MEEGGSFLEKVLIYAFNHGDVALNVKFLKDKIIWDKLEKSESPHSNGSPKKTSEKCSARGSVEWRYVLSAELVANGSSLEIYYIDKQPKNLWTKKVLKLKGSEANCRECAVEVKQRLYQVDGRPTNLLIFVNPVSGTAKNGLKIYKTTVAPLLQLANIASEAVVTTHRGHITEYLHENNVSRFDGVIVVGGDGTFTEAFTGILVKEARGAAMDINQHTIVWPKPRLRIGIVPAGTGQGMIKAATGSKDVTTAVLHIIVGLTINIPCLSVHNGDRFVATGSMLAGYGFFGDAIRASEAKRSLGLVRYPYGMIKTIVNHRQFNLDLRYLTNMPEKRCRSENVLSVNNNPTTDAGATASSHSSPMLHTKHSPSPPPHKPLSRTLPANTSPHIPYFTAHTFASNSNVGQGSNSRPKSDELGKGVATHAQNGGGDASASDVTGSMENVDITADNSADTWVHETGAFRALNIFVLNIAARNAEADVYVPGGLSCTFVRAAAGRWKHMGVIARSLGVLSGWDSVSEDIANNVILTDLEFRILDHTEASLAQLANSERREVINVDGDPYTLLHPQVYIRKQDNVMSLFGQRPTESFRW